MSIVHIRPRSGVILAASLVIVLAGVLAIRLPARELLAAPHGDIPEPRSFQLSELTIPCWSCPNSEKWPIRFRTDLDALAPLGTGSGNAAEWFASFAKPDGARVAEGAAAMERRIDHPSLGRILPGDDPLLLEAEPWCDQATMRFYPDLLPIRGGETRFPDLILSLTFARSWIARGQQAERFEDARADFQRAIRLGRLLRQEDVALINDLVGLSIIRIGAEAMYARARDEGAMDLALLSAVIAGEAPSQRLLSAARMTEAEIVPYLPAPGNTGARMTVIPEDHFKAMRDMALEDPDRRFRLTAAFSLSVVASLGAVEQQQKAKEILETLVKSDDALIAEGTRYYLEHPTDEKVVEKLKRSE